MNLKNLISLIFIVICQIAFSQEKKGFINDPDGYTNVRESANGKSEIISKIIDGEIFSYRETENPWFPVKTYKGIEGFVHNSRIKEFKISKDLRLNENMQELLLFRHSGKVISVCGIPFRKENDLQLYSGLIVGDGLNNIKYSEYSEGTIQSIELKNGQIYVYEYANLPIDKEFTVNLVPYSINRTFFNGDRVLNSLKNAFYDFPKIENEFITKTINELKDKNHTETEFYRIINTALVLALNNEKLAENFLLNLESELNISFDGEYGEKYQETLLVYELNKNNR